MKTAVKIATVDWTAWLEALSRQRTADQALYGHLDGLDCDASLFDIPDFQDRIKETGMRCLHERNLVANDASAALSMASHQRCLPQFYAQIYHAMGVAGSVADCQAFSMPFRLDRLPANASGEDGGTH
ncbi:MAG: hypothetical protein IJJ33_16200, partial [Victivallales bacterium]|nr:hypothetical protein [Victivallales bacterium]